MVSIKQLDDYEHENTNDYLYFVNGELIHIFDIPHRLITTRNCLYKNNVVVDQNEHKVLEMKYRQDCYNIDCPLVIK